MMTLLLIRQLPRRLQAIHERYIYVAFEAAETSRKSPLANYRKGSSGVGDYSWSSAKPHLTCGEAASYPNSSWATDNVAVT
jgi:hypothetical protein